MILRGVDIANPALNLAELLSDQAKALYPQIDERCLDGLARAGLVRRPRAGRACSAPGADIARSSPR